MESASYADWRDRLATANNPAFWPIEAIDAELQANRAQFWACDTAALVTRVVDYPGGARVVEAMLGAGVKNGLTEQLEQTVETWARSIDAAWLFAPGRLGWMRELKPKGWELHHVTMRKDLR